MPLEDFLPASPVTMDSVRTELWAKILPYCPDFS